MFTREQIESARLVRLRGMGNGLNLDDVNLDKLAELHKSAKELSYDCVRNTKKLEILTNDALFIEDVINADPRIPVITSAIRAPKEGCFGSLIDKISFYWYVKCWKCI